MAQAITGLQNPTQAVGADEAPEDREGTHTRSRSLPIQLASSLVNTSLLRPSYSVLGVRLGSVGSSGGASLQVASLPTSTRLPTVLGEFSSVPRLLPYQNKVGIVPAAVITDFLPPLMVQALGHESVY